MSKPQVGLIMGSQTDWSTMREAADVLSELNIAYEKKLYPLTELQTAYGRTESQLSQGVCRSLLQELVEQLICQE